MHFDFDVDEYWSQNREKDTQGYFSDLDFRDPSTRFYLNHYMKMPLCLA